MPTNYSPNLNLRLPDTGDIGWDQPLNENIVQTDAILAQILAGNGIAQGLAPTDGGALDIDYAAGRAETIYGSLGIKVWICKGEILGKRVTD